MISSLTIFVTHFEPDAAATVATLESIACQSMRPKATVFVLDNGTVDRGASGSVVRAACDRLGREFMYQRCRKEQTRAALLLAYTPMVFTKYIMFMEQGVQMASERVLEALQASIEGAERNGMVRVFAGSHGVLRGGDITKARSESGYGEVRSGAVPRVPFMLSSYNFNIVGGLVARDTDAEMYRLNLRLAARYKFAVCADAEFVLPGWSDERRESYGRCVEQIKREVPAPTGYVEPVATPVAEEIAAPVAEVAAEPAEWFPTLDEPEPVAAPKTPEPLHSGRYTNGLGSPNLAEAL